MTSSKPTYLPEASLPNNIASRVRTSTYDFWGRYRHSVHNKLHIKLDFLVYIFWSEHYFECLGGYCSIFPGFKGLTCGKVNLVVFQKRNREL